ATRAEPHVLADRDVEVAVVAVKLIAKLRRYVVKIGIHEKAIGPDLRSRADANGLGPGRNRHAAHRAVVFDDDRGGRVERSELDGKNRGARASPRRRDELHAIADDHLAGARANDHAAENIDVLSELHVLKNTRHRKPQPPEKPEERLVNTVDGDARRVRDSAMTDAFEQRACDVWLRGHLFLVATNTG